MKTFREVFRKASVLKSEKMMSECSLFSNCYGNGAAFLKEICSIPFNMGVGMTVIVAKEDAEKTLEVLKANGEDAYILGEVVKSEEGVELW